MQTAESRKPSRTMTLLPGFRGEIRRLNTVDVAMPLNEGRRMSTMTSFS